MLQRGRLWIPRSLFKKEVIAVLPGLSWVFSQFVHQPNLENLAFTTIKEAFNFFLQHIETITEIHNCLNCRE